MKKRNWIPFLLLIAFLFCPVAGWSLGEGQLKPLATGGFGDSANSYSWGLTEFKGDIYVSTGRHHLWSVMTAVGSMIGEGIDIGAYIEGPPDPDSWQHPETGGATEAWADANRAEVWRLKASDGKWERVLQSGTYFLSFTDAIYSPQIPGLPLMGYYPNAYAYRTLGTFDGRIYVLGVGTWMPPIANTTILRSASGNPGTWEVVSGNLAQTTNIRGFAQWGDHVYVAVAVPGDGILAGGSVVYRKSNDESAGVYWEPVSDIGFNNADNEEVNYLQVFNDCLYASTVNYDTGFEVWKTCNNTLGAAEMISTWVNVIDGGFGDTWCQSGLHMEPFGDYLYVGTAVPIGMVLKDQQPVGSRGTDIIRIDTNDHAELVVGAYIPSDPPEGWPTSRVPLSGLGAGFGNPLNVYSWHMGVYQGSLIVGTFDMTGITLYTLKEQIKSAPEGVLEAIQDLAASNNSIPEELLGALQILDLTDPAQVAAVEYIIDYLIDQFGGGDLWQTKDGINWKPLTLSGLGNWHNYGFRRVVPVQLDGEEALFLGTANPFTGIEGGGCEVWFDGPKSLRKLIKKNKKKANNPDRRPGH